MVRKTTRILNNHGCLTQPELTEGVLMRKWSNSSNEGNDLRYFEKYQQRCRITRVYIVSVISSVTNRSFRNSSFSATTESNPAYREIVKKTGPIRCFTKVHNIYIQSGVW